MSGIIPPSVVTYSYTVDNQFSKYVNVSFPFRTKIDSVWFTGDSNLLNTADGESNDPASVLEGAFRTLKLAGVKAKSPKVVLSSYDIPTDWNNFFGTEDLESTGNADEALKPTMWLGIPDDATQEVLKDSTTQFCGTPFWGAGFRSSSATAPKPTSEKNGYWYNNDWNPEQFDDNKYRTDLSVMNPDEILSLFVYNADGDWSDYDGTGIVTIHIAYTGIGEGYQPADPKAPWLDWWYD